MKAVIHRILYDTEAEGTVEVAVRGNGFPVNDFKHCVETLYKSATGLWFLRGEGGPLSRWCESRGGSSAWGSGIEALTDEEAMEWLETAGEINALLEHFPDKIVRA